MSDSEAPKATNFLNSADAPEDDAAEGTNPWSSSTNLGQLHTEADGATVDSQLISVDPGAAVGPILQPEKPESPVAQMESSENSKADLSILNEFDPLASDPVEQNARDAWAAAESHPPPTPAKDPSVPNPPSVISPTLPSSAPPQGGEEVSQSPARDSEQPASSVPQSAPATSSTFPSLASLARTLTLSPRRSSTPPIPPPPRSSSLRHAHHTSTSSIPSSPVIPASPTVGRPIEKETRANMTREDPGSGSGVTSNSEGVTVTSSPKPDGQFDFQRFLDQMKTKGADPIAKYLRSFLSNFAKKTFAVNDQIKIIHDFLDFIADKMRAMDGSPWQNTPQQEFDNAMEAMEKLVMNRLYEFTFQPLLPPPLRTTDDLERDHVLRQRISLFGWLREEHLDVPTGSEAGQGGKEVKGFLEFAQQELLKINHYKAPRDKLICILNCCKVIFGLIRHVRMAEGADSFIPILIFVVLKANPEHLLSNVEYINRFRSPNKLQSEAGYYLSSLMGAVSFIETMDHSSLSNISQEEFERNVEEAIEALPVTRTPSPPPSSPFTPVRPRTPRTPNTSGTPLPVRPPPSPLAGEEAARPLSLPMPSSSSSGSPAGPNPADPNISQLSIADDTRRFIQRTSDTISKPLAAIGRIFTDVLDGPEPGAPGQLAQQGDRSNERKMGWRDLPGPFAPLSVGAEEHQNRQQPPIQHWSHPDQMRQHGGPPQVPHTPMADGTYQPPIQTPYKPRIRPSYSNSPSNSYSGSPAGSEFTPTSRGQPLTNQPLAMGTSQNYRQSPTLASVPHTTLGPRYLQAGSPHPSRNPTPTLDFGAMQDEIDRAHLAAQDAARETLMQIFPTVDKEVAEMVLEANDGDLGRSIEGLLEISGQTGVQ